MKVLFFGNTIPVQSVRNNSARQFFQTSGDSLELRYSGQLNPNLTEQKAQRFIEKHSKAIEQLSNAASKAAWASTCQGTAYIEPGQIKTDEQREAEAETAFKDYFNNPQAFAEVQAIMRDGDKITDRLIMRQITKLLEAFEDAGKNPELLAQERDLRDRTSQLTGVYNSYRAVVDGKKVSNTEISQRLQETDDPVEVKKLWLASNGHGQMEIAPGGSTLAVALAGLAKQRNAVARQHKSRDGQPYPDYFAEGLDRAEIKEAALAQLLEQVEEATREPYERYRKATEAFSQKRYGVTEVESKLPWYGSGNLKRMLQFDLQPYLQGKNPLALLQKTAQLMGDDLQPVFEKSTYVKNGETRSSIYFDPAKDDGKSQHWFSFSMNAPNDVRIFGSVNPEHRNSMDTSMGALLHEGTGHGLDGIYIDPTLPYLLREHHSITTECHAMLLENLMESPDWLEKVLEVPKADALALAQRAKAYSQSDSLFKARNMLTLIQFEWQMYRNPDQDLNKLWWDLQEKYMGVKRPPEGDLPTYARIPHFFSHPVYYQNYFLADLARAQKLEYINQNFGGLLTREAGDYLRTYRRLGEQFDWDDLIERMTGKPLTADALKREFETFQATGNA